MLLNFLNNHITSGADFQARVKWQEKSVVILDVSYQPLTSAYLGGYLSNRMTESCNMSLSNPGLGKWAETVCSANYSAG